MKHPEYDSPFELVMSDITTQMARNIDEMCWNAVQRVGINVDKEKLLAALIQDAERYRDAFANGYETGYTKREEEIILCKECKHVCLCDATEMMPDIPVYAKCTLTDEVHDPDWYCADGERRPDNG